MIDAGTAGLGFLLMLGLMFLGLHVAVALFLIGILGAYLYLGMPIVDALGTQVWGNTDNFVLLAVPLFVLLGELLVQGGATERMYRALASWLNPLPGGLLHTNIGASALLAAVSGSSVATTATIGTVALPTFAKRRYDNRLVLGSIAAGATLGILIPPSINMIIYGALTNTSVGRLYLAGFLPGALMALLFMVVIAVACHYRPQLAGEPEAGGNWRERLRGLVDLMPPVVIFLVVMGSIYAGWATPTESAAIGVIIALMLAAGYGNLSIAMLHRCFLTTVKLTGLIVFIVAAAFYLNFVIGILGIPQSLSRFVAGIGTTPLMLIWVLVVFYLLMGCFLETLSMMVGTIPIVFPLVAALGIDPVWFGIFLVVMCEMALITPPIGMNLYVVQGVRGGGDMGEVIQGVLPFLAMMMVLVVLLIAVPGLALWLPDLLFKY